jgi:hypothetical protein
MQTHTHVLMALLASAMVNFIWAARNLLRLSSDTAVTRHGERKTKSMTVTITTASSSFVAHTRTHSRTHTRMRPP